MHYELVFKADGCHKYFRDERGRIVVADESGFFPEQTDDGVLYLDKKRRIQIGDERCYIPLTNGLSTPAGFKEALLVSGFFDMSFEPIEYRHATKEELARPHFTLGLSPKSTVVTKAIHKAPQPEEAHAAAT